jgi:hypothetical protein
MHNQQEIERKDLQIFDPKTLTIYKDGLRHKKHICS